LEKIDLLQFNRVIVSAPVERAALAEMIARFRAAGLKKFGVQIAPSLVEARGWLPELGLVVGSRWAKLSRAAGAPPAVEPSLGIAEVEPRHAQLFGKLICDAYGVPAPLAPWNAALVGRPGWRAYLAWDAGTAVGAALTYINDGCAWLGVDATLPPHRGRGAESALIARRIADVVAAGAHTLVAETVEDSGSFRNYLKHGFQLAYLRENWVTKSASG
jgi:GNAT superfamily N-acetyltransferase